MRRRKFLTLLGSTVAAAPLSARAQQTAQARRIGVVIALAENHPEARANAAALRDSLEKLSWTEGRNIRIDYRWGIGDPARARVAVKDLLALSPDLIMPATTQMLVAAKEASRLRRHRVREYFRSDRHRLRRQCRSRAADQI